MRPNFLLQAKVIAERSLGFADSGERQRRTDEQLEAEYQSNLRRGNTDARRYRIWNLVDITDEDPR